MNSGQGQREFLRAVARELRWRPWARRRLLTELAQHLDESAADLRASGLSDDAAARQAISRLGDAQTIARAFRSATGHRWPRLAQSLRSPAWLAVGAMSLVTLWAAELPQASGAAPPRYAAPAAGHRGFGVIGREPHRRASRHLPVRS